MYQPTVKAKEKMVDKADFIERYDLEVAHAIYHSHLTKQYSVT